MPLNPTPKDLQRFLAKVEKTGNCWIWIGSIDKGGYGLFGITVSKYNHKMVLAHRFCYELFKEDIPKGLTLDHLCRNRACVNPDHLEAVTQKVNLMRGFGFCSLNAQKTHCPRGHELAGDNLDRHYLRKGWRYCRICHNQLLREKRQLKEISINH